RMFSMRRTARLGRGRLKSWGDGFQTTFSYLKLHKTTFLNIVIVVFKSECCSGSGRLKRE
ncbi:hypothetical protein, partial [Neisseria sp. HMSC074B07]|uniref:hypothetical protein n=1 Tax=Neisseria sp. HMSC074B07 TaxID=1715205 RepID=UPI001AEF3F4E